MQMHGRDALRPVPTGRGAVHVQHQEEARASQGRDSRGATAARRWVGVLEEKDERQPFFVGGIFDIGAGASFILQYKGDRPRGPRRVEVPGLLSGALHADVSENLYLWQHLALSVVFPSCCFVPFLVCVLCLCCACDTSQQRRARAYPFCFSYSCDGESVFGWFVVCQTL